MSTSSAKVPEIDEISHETYLKASKHDTYSYISSLEADLSGKSVMITGASRGIGQAMAISYAKAGASKIAIAARTDLSLVKTAITKAARDANRKEPQILTIKIDISSETECDNAAKQIEENFGTLDILINNAGYMEQWAKIADAKVDNWWKSFEVNLKGMFLMCRAFIPVLLKGGDKTIITVSSIGAIAVQPTGSAYETAKNAQLRLTDFLNKEYHDQDLLAYCIHPGAVKTDLATDMPEFMHKILNDKPELAGDSVVWLTKEKRSWLVSRYVNVTWDMEELLSKREEIEKNNLLRMRLRT